MSRTNFHGPKDVRAIEVRLYFGVCQPIYVNSKVTVGLMSRPFYRHICVDNVNDNDAVY